MAASGTGARGVTPRSQSSRSFQVAILDSAC